MYNINYSVLNFTISFNDDARLVENKESAIRGILGNALLDMYCIRNSKERQCINCYYKEKCIPSTIFNAKLKKEVSFLSDNIVAPFIIHCNDKREVLEYGEGLNFTMIIFGDTGVFIPQIISAFAYAGQYIGLRNNKFIVENVTNDLNEAIYDGTYMNKELINYRNLSQYIDMRLNRIEDKFTMNITKPIRFKSKGKFKDDLSIGDIYDLLSRRIIILNALEGNSIDKFDDDFSIEILNKDITWSEHERFSNRQKSSMLLGGVVGNLEILSLNEFSKKLLIAGELMHIGKNTSFGMGEYFLE